MHRENKLLALILILLICTSINARKLNFSLHSSNKKLAEKFKVMAQNGARTVCTYLDCTSRESNLATINIYIATSEREFYQLTTGGIPDWGVGVAIPSQNKIVLKSSAKFKYPLKASTLITHEIAHILLEKALKNNRYPRWFSEGFAQYVSTDWSFKKTVKLSYATVAGNLVDLSALESLNSFNQVKAHLAYSESYTAFKMLYESIGRNGFHSLIKNIRRRKDFEQGFQQTMGMGLEKFYKLWKKRVSQDYHPIYILSDTRFIYFFLTGLFIIVAIIKMFQVWIKKRRLEKEDERKNFDNSDSFSGGYYT